MPANAVAIPFTYTHQHPSRTLVYRSLASMVAPPRAMPRFAQEEHLRRGRSSQGGNRRSQQHPEDAIHTQRKPKATGMVSRGEWNSRAESRYKQIASNPSSERGSSRGSSARSQRNGTPRRKTPERKKKGGRNNRAPTDGTILAVDTILRQENEDLRAQLKMMEERFARLEEGMGLQREHRAEHNHAQQAQRKNEELGRTFFGTIPSPHDKSRESFGVRNHPHNTFEEEHTPVDSSHRHGDHSTTNTAPNYMEYEHKTAHLRSWYETSPSRDQQSPSKAVTPLKLSLGQSVHGTPLASPARAATSPGRRESPKGHHCHHESNFGYTCVHPHHHPSHEPTSFTEVVDEVARQKAKFAHQVHKPLPPGTFKDYQDFMRGYELLELERARKRDSEQAREQARLSCQKKEIRKLSTPAATISPKELSKEYRRPQSDCVIAKGHSAASGRAHSSNGTPRKRTIFKEDINTRPRSAAAPSSKRKLRKRSASSKGAPSLPTPTVSAIHQLPSTTNNTILHDGTFSLHNLSEDLNPFTIPCGTTRSGEARPRVQLYSTPTPKRDPNGKKGYCSEQRQLPNRMQVGGAVTRSSDDYYWVQSRSILDDLGAAFALGF